MNSFCGPSTTSTVDDPLRASKLECQSFQHIVGLWSKADVLHYCIIDKVRESTPWKGGSRPFFSGLPMLLGTIAGQESHVLPSCWSDAAGLILEPKIDFRNEETAMTLEMNPLIVNVNSLPPPPPRFFFFLGGGFLIYDSKRQCEAYNVCLQRWFG